MEENFISYKDICEDQNSSLFIEEKTEKHIIDPDPKLMQDIITLFEITEKYIQIDSFIELKTDKIDPFFKKLNYTYNEFGERVDYEYCQKRSKTMLKNITWEKEVALVKDQDKLHILKSILDQWKIIDKIRFINTQESPITCLWVMIMKINDWDDEEDDYLSLYSTFVLKVIRRRNFIANCYRSNQRNSRR